MKSFFKIAVLLLISTRVFALDTQNLDGIKQDIQLLKTTFASDCQPASEDVMKLFVTKNSKICLRQEASLQKSLCSKKMELISYLEAITTKQNIMTLAKRFGGELPPADALGAVMIWQMKNSIDQVNNSWAEKVDKYRLNRRCSGKTAEQKAVLKNDLFRITNYFKNVIDQTTLMVDAQAEMQK